MALDLGHLLLYLYDIRGVDTLEPKMYVQPRATYSSSASSHTPWL